MKKSNGITYLGLAVALATWYNKKRKLQGRDREIIDMENYMQTTGIKQTVIQEIQELAVKHGVSRVILFGSRARGTFREKSDIDLAVEGGDFIRFSLDVDENTSTLLKYDFINLDEPIQEELRASIQKKRGSCCMKKFDHFKSNLKILEKADKEDLTNEFIFRWNY